MVKQGACFIILIAVTNIAIALPTAKVTIKVLNEAEQPIESAHVEVYFELERGVSNKDVDLTDEQGIFVASGSTIQNVGGCIIRKEGYYDSFCRGYSGTSVFTGITGIPGFRRWQPWNPTLTVVLKKIKNPIPLYRRVFGSENTDYPEHRLPKANEYVGLDLIESDWVAPYGRGVRSDFLFKIEKDIKSMFDYNVTLYLKFQNKGDGIQSYYTPADNTSQFRMPYQAPKDGYQSELVINKIDRPKVVERSTFRGDQNYFFRVRTELDEEGHVKSALYGKIERNIEFLRGITISPTAEIKFTYVINPVPNDTNLEMGSNLFGDRFRKRR